MALYNRELKFIYLFEPHTASRAILHHLPKYVPKTAQIPHHHIGIQEMTNWRKQLLRPKDALEARIVCTVRNPLDTLITRWRVSSFQHVSFQRFFDNNKEHHQITEPGMGLFREAEYHCYYEDLEDDLRWMFNRPELELGWNEDHKTKDKEPWYTYYSYDMVEYLKDVYKQYLNQFGYQISFRDGRPFCEIDPDIRALRCQKLL